MVKVYVQKETNETRNKQRHRKCPITRSDEFLWN
jgi:hypothetical protein